MVYKTQQFSRSSDGMKRDIAHLVLTTLEDAARCSPIPFLQEAATLALGILRIIDVCTSLNTDAESDAF